VEYVWADLRDADAVAAAVRGVDAVSHQAAMVGLGVDLADVTDYVAHNDLGTAVLLRALHEAGFAGPLVLGSSMVVYGEGGYRCRLHGCVTPRPRSRADLDAGRFDPPCPRCGAPLEPIDVTEDARLDPRNVYAATKLHQEHLVAAYAREHGSRSVALRYHNVYGPRMPRDTPYAGVASIVRSALERGEAPRIFEDGAQRRNFVHVADVARANAIALDAHVAGAFNIAGPTSQTVLEMARALADAFPGAPSPEVVGGGRLGDVRHVTASPDRARHQLGFTATIAFADGIGAFATAPLREPATR
jgi:dTDP-L-rhamnose 4-epimerase